METGAPEAPKVKKPYTPPAVTETGTLEQLTQGTGTPGIDSVETASA